MYETILRLALRWLPLIGVWYLIAGSTACWPVEQEVLTEVEVDLSDTTFQRLYNYQDQGQTDSLFGFFDHKDPSYRYTAALAFASHRDAGAVDSLVALLSDPVDRVRAAAAYALGQISEAEALPALIRAFNRNDTSGRWALSNGAILAAVGKCGALKELQQISEVSTYSVRDSLLLIGQAEAIYQFGLRDIHDSAGIARAISMTRQEAYPQLARLLAANYLGRSTTIDLDTVHNELTQLYRQESDPYIRMALALALGNVTDSLALPVVKQALAQESDYRVRNNLLRSMSRYDYARVQESLLGALRDPHPQVALQAAQSLRSSGSPQDATFYWRLAKDSLPARVQLHLYAAANKHLPFYFAEFRDAINYELRQRYQQSVDAYEQAWALDAMAEWPWNYRFLYQQALESESPVVRSAAAEGLYRINQDEKFMTSFGQGWRRVRNELATVFSELIKDGDAGGIYYAARALRQEDRAYNQVIDSLGFLADAMDALTLPRDIEVYYELQATHQALSGAEPTPRESPAWNHNINWPLLGSLQSRPTARILTDRGIIRLELLPDLAPATVANFIELGRQGFFNGLVFHRVVPNFVVQGGCTRGDGFGSLNYTIRSEVPPTYYDTEGLVGMASAGPHTESNQFFITHSPTLHLSGDYTIFAKVVEGMDIVHELQVGDRIKQITIRDI